MCEGKLEEGSVCEGEGMLEEGCVGLSCRWAGGACMCMLEEYVQDMYHFCQKWNMGANNPLTFPVVLIIRHGHASVKQKRLCLEVRRQ